MVAMMGVASLAVDYGRTQLVRSQLRAAADAASRNGAMMLRSGAATAIIAASSAAADNSADGQAVSLVASDDIELGYWNTSTRVFQKLIGSAQANANAIRVVAKRLHTRNNGVPLLFSQMLGKNDADVSGESISMIQPPTIIETDVPATTNPYLAGMPKGTKASLQNPHNSPDTAGKQSPIEVTGLAMREGEVLTFDNIAGGANNDISWSERFQPDGNLSWQPWNKNGVIAEGQPELGKSNMKAPINALVGVFLTDEDPRSQATPEALTFDTAEKRNFEKLEPKIAQVFFIGDGKRDNGAAQRFVVPKGATRFYLANWDEYEWNNNVGLRTTRITRLGSVVTVK